MLEAVAAADWPPFARAELAAFEALLADEAARAAEPLLWEKRL
jgi:hypothetical protein